ncbi:MAG TPA: hypothetical protein VFT43_15085, partial [Candidatus Polarisedimenticolia bacterium]|nr:hypothetical protein [Candidatus Polarisedimenticolia bacterium]
MTHSPQAMQRPTLNARPRPRGRRFTARLLPALLLSLTLLAANRGARGAEAEWSFRLALDGRYDDNIIQLSDRDIRRLENPRPQDITSNRFSTETPDDFIAIPRFSSGLKTNWLDGRPTSLDFDLALYQYAKNGIKNYQSYRVALTQPLHGGRKHTTDLHASYALVPDFYVRNLVSDRAIEESGIFPFPSPLPREEATYRKKIAQVEIEQEIVPDRLAATGALGSERRDYNRLFDERDSRMPFEEAQIAWTPRHDGTLRLRLAYRRETLRAHGD